MRDLSIIIPGRNEMFMARTIINVLENIRADSEVIAVCDGAWPDPPIQDHPRLKIIHHSEAVGQRAATNEGARLSQAKFVMKLDAHCAVDEGFDAKLIADWKPGMTIIPAQYSLHAFDWMCADCGSRTYQRMPPGCDNCKSTNVTMDIIWKRRERHVTYSWRFDKNLQFQYWNHHSRRDRRVRTNKIIETMSFIGACMFLEREKFWELGGMDEAHGSWGQFGTEWACKTWLSGGQLVTTKNTWFAHMFRTGNFSRDGRSTWPYPISQKQIDRARDYSRDFWLNDKWPKAIHPLSWLINKFAPIPDWHENAQ